MQLYTALSRTWLNGNAQFYLILFLSMLPTKKKPPVGYGSIQLKEGLICALDRAIWGSKASL